MDAREQHKSLFMAERADNPTAIKVYRAIATNYRRNGIRMGVATSIEALCNRLERADIEIIRLRGIIDVITGPILTQ